MMYIISFILISWHTIYDILDFVTLMSLHNTYHILVFVSLTSHHNTTQHNTTQHNTTQHLPHTRLRIPHITTQHLPHTRLRIPRHPVHQYLDHSLSQRISEYSWMFQQLNSLHNKWDKWHNSGTQHVALWSYLHIWQWKGAKLITRKQTTNTQIEQITKLQSSVNKSIIGELQNMINRLSSTQAVNMRIRLTHKSFEIVHRHESKAGHFLKQSII